jgi:hypothetical protein
VVVGLYIMASGDTTAVNDLVTGTELLKATHPFFFKATHPPKVLGWTEHLLWLERLRKENENHNPVSTVLKPKTSKCSFECFTPSPPWLKPHKKYACRHVPAATSFSSV